MTSPILSGGAGKGAKVADVHVVAIFNPATGEIVHVHNVIVLEGGRSVSEKEAIDAAWARASEWGHGPEKLKAKTSKNPLHGQLPHRIDPASGNFVAIDFNKAGAAGPGFRRRGPSNH